MKKIEYIITVDTGDGSTGIKPVVSQENKSHTSPTSYSSKKSTHESPTRCRVGIPKTTLILKEANHAETK